MSKKLCDEYRKESYGTTLPNKQKSFPLPDQSMCILEKYGLYYKDIAINPSTSYIHRYTFQIEYLLVIS